MTDKNSKLSQEVSTLQSVTVSQKDDISSLREEISKARGDNGKLSRERTQLKREVEDERARFANLQNELMETGRAVAEQETRWREELSAEKLRVQSLERSLADEERRIKKMEEECDKLGKIAEERGKLKAMVEASVSRERHLEIVREKLEKRVYAAEAQVKVAQEERARFEKEESTRSHRDREMLNQEIASLRGFVNKVQDEKSQIAVLYERERANFELQSVMIESLGRETKQVTQTGMEREKLLEAATRDLKESQSQVVALRQEITSLREKMDKKDVQTDSLRDVADAARADVVKKDKQIVDLEFIIASTTSPTKKSRDDEANLKLQRREKEILRLREMMAALIRDNEELIAQSNEVIVPEQQKKYIAMKNVLRAENLRRKALERELARALTKNSSSQEDVGRTPGAKSIVSFYDTPGSVVGGLDTPVSLKDTPVSMRGFGGAEDTPLKGKGVLAVE
jgi:structural maintenance of chromosome 4